MLRALVFYGPVFILAVLLTAFSLYLGQVEEPNCRVIFGYSASVWGLLLFCFGLPGLVLLASIYLFYAGWHSIKQGVYPPTNVPALGMKIRSGKVARVQAVIALAFPLLALGIAVLGWNAFHGALQGNTLNDLQVQLVRECSQP